MGMTVTITRTFKVLGDIVNDRNDFAQDDAARGRALATTPLRKTALKRDKITNAAKIHYLNALGYSRYTIQCRNMDATKRRTQTRSTLRRQQQRGWQWALTIGQYSGRRLPTSRSPAGRASRRSHKDYGKQGCERSCG
eukprot:6978402-Pyramimonas_sp.AAC.1